MHKLNCILVGISIILLLPLDVRSQGMNTSEKEDETVDINKWRISAGMGYGQRIANFDKGRDNMLWNGFDQSSVDDYIKSIKRGYKIAGQLHYMFWDNMGLGLDYNFFHSSGQLAGYVSSPSQNTDTYIYMRMEDNVFTNYLGASLLSEWRFGNDQFKLNSQFSMGYTMFRNEVLFNHEPTLLIGNSLGLNLEVGIEYFIVPYLSIGSSACFFNSSLSQMKVDNGYEIMTVDMEKDERESLNRLDMSINLNYYF